MLSLFTIVTVSLIRMSISQSESCFASPRARDPNRISFADGSILFISLRIRPVMFVVLLVILQIYKKSLSLSKVLQTYWQRLTIVLSKR